MPCFGASYLGFSLQSREADSCLWGDDLAVGGALLRLFGQDWRFTLTMPFYRQGELEGKESEKGRFLPVFGSADRHCKVVTIQL